MAVRGFLAFVLHAHLPFVRHPEHRRFLEEDWLFEAITETYLPLLDVFERLRADGVRFQVSMALSPTLLSMLTDDLLQRRYLRYLDERIAALKAERRRVAGERAYKTIVDFYYELYHARRRRFVERDRHDLTRALRALGEAGCLDLMTCAATHGYLPLLAVNPESLRAQLAVAVKTHERILGRKPRGIWLPECGYRPGLDQVLQEFGLEYFVLDSHGLLNADPRPKYGVHRPIRTPSGAAAFARDYDSSKQVWSATEGYPGDPIYRDFYRDAGFDLRAAHIKKLWHAGRPGFTGLKYHRITGATDEKEIYHPEAARARADKHARDFIAKRRAQVDWLAYNFDRAPVVVAPYDAELFGHWWFEGPRWLESALRDAARDQSEIEAVGLRHYLEIAGELQPAAPAESSWGEGGYHEVWLNEKNDWMYPLLYAAAQRMARLARAHPEANGRRREALDCAARELLLAQASDWAFMLKTGKNVDYARARFNAHLERFARCAQMAETNRFDSAVLRSIEKQDKPFPDLDYRVFLGRSRS